MALALASRIAGMMRPMAERKSPSGPANVFCAGIDAGAGNPFVQGRLALLGKVMFLVSFGFFAIMNGMLLVGGGVAFLPHLINQRNIWHFLASSVMAVLWLIMSGRQLPLRV